MKAHRWFVLSALVLGLLAAPAAARAAIVGMDVEVLVNTVSQGSATSSGGIFDVTVNAGDTVRFIVGIGAGYAGTNLTNYATTVNADDPTEIDYTVGSQAELTGLNFTALAQPDNSLNDGTPNVGAVNSTNGSVALTLDLYRIDYVVQAGVNSDASVDFSVTATVNSNLPSSTDAVTGTAQIRLNAGAGVPEPATLLLLGSGLAGLAGFGHRRARR